MHCSNKRDLEWCHYRAGPSCVVWFRLVHRYGAVVTFPLAGVRRLCLRPSARTPPQEGARNNGLLWTRPGNWFMAFLRIPHTVAYSLRQPCFFSVWSGWWKTKQKDIWVISLSVLYVLVCLVGLSVWLGVCVCVCVVVGVSEREWLWCFFVSCVCKGEIQPLNIPFERQN